MAGRSPTAGGSIVGARSSESNAATTDVGRMRVGELVGKALANQDADLLRHAVRWLAEQLTQAKVTVAAGASYALCHPDRVAHRNGYRQQA